jgi:hypothetical protein
MPRTRAAPQPIALVKRSRPFSLPPPELEGGEISFTVPVRFNIR